MAYMLVIRKAKVGDIPAVVRLALGLLEYHSKFDPYYAPAKDVEAVYTKFLKKCAFSSKRQLLVAEFGDELVGYALGEIGFRPPVFKMRKIGFINDMFVVKKHRKTGIGKLFLDNLIKWFKSKKLTYAELTVHVKNEIGKRVWAKFGFKGYIIKQRIKL